RSFAAVQTGIRTGAKEDAQRSNEHQQRCDCEWSPTAPLSPSVRRWLDQPITRPRDGFYREPTSSLGELPKRRDRAVDYVVPDEAALPALINELIACDELAALPRERDQDLQVLRLKTLRLAVECRVARERIDARPPHSKRLFRSRIDRGQRIYGNCFQERPPRDRIANSRGATKRHSGALIRIQENIRSLPSSPLLLASHAR